jgi:hypothetical protein
MGTTTYGPIALTVASIVVLAVSSYFPWMAPGPDATMIPTIGFITRGYRVAPAELIFLSVPTVASGVALILPWNRAKGGLLCVLGLGYAVLPHYHIAQRSVSLPRPFEPMIVGPSLASVAGCLAFAAGILVLRDSVETPW